VDETNTECERNAIVVRQLVEDAFGRGKTHLLPELLDPSHVSHMSIGDHYGPEGVRIAFAAYHAAMPDLVVTLDDVIADGDMVARRFTLRGTMVALDPGNASLAASIILHGVAIDRLRTGRIAESWVVIESADLDGDRAG
jgi:predicted ester cyclase